LRLISRSDRQLLSGFADVSSMRLPECHRGARPSISPEDCLRPFERLWTPTVYSNSLAYHQASTSSGAAIILLVRTACSRRGVLRSRIVTWTILNSPSCLL